LVDSEHILGRLKENGHTVVDIEQAEVGIINTCAFIKEAKEESIDVILDLVELKKEGRLKKIIVYGCLSQRYKDLLRRRLPEVDAFVGKVSLNHSPARFPITPRHYAYLKISEGCVNHCSFCVIPRIKGALRSLDIATLERQAASFDKERISELNIIGQDITGYGLDRYARTRLAAALKKIIRHAPHIHWIRLLYLYPSRITDDLLRLIRDSRALCKYIDLPLQHSNDRILKLMNRHTNKKDSIRLIEKIRKFIPEVGLRTSFIVGFPTETEKEFAELLRFIEEYRFERLGAFMYSREEESPAYDFTPQVAHQTKLKRLNRLMALQQNIARSVNERFLGKEVEVLIDQQENGRYLGRTQYDAPEVDGGVFVKSSRPLKIGDFVKVRIVDTLEYDLMGEVMP